MMEPEEALARILARVSPLPPREVSILDGLDCFAVEEVFAKVALPPFDNSAMDGYAVRAVDCVAKARLKVMGEQPAGPDRRLRVNEGEAIRIFTGAPLPLGVDAVVMQEDVSVHDSEIELHTNVATGESIRRRGGDVAEGQRILAVGDRITPPLIALLAAQGVRSIKVGGEVRVAVISTGDELVAPGTELRAGEIYDSNSPLLQALLRKCGAKVESISHCADDAEEVREAVRAGMACDAMIVTGGVSVGARDFVKEAITTAGGTLDLWRVAVKPGKPFLFGHADRCAIFGLPGNPVSAFVTFLLFVRPALLKLMGASESALQLPTAAARAEEEVQNPGDRTHYLRGVLHDGIFRPTGRQESHALFGLSRSNALLMLRPGETIAAGAMVHVVQWGWAPTPVG